MNALSYSGCSSTLGSPSQTANKSHLDHDAVSPHWNCLQSSVNLPAVLNDPSYRQLDIFSRTWGDQFERNDVHPSPRLPHIDQKDFTPYLNKLKVRVRRSFISSKNTSDYPPAKSADSGRPSIPLSDTLLKSIPSIYFDRNFNLQQSDYFNHVIPLFSRQRRQNTYASRSLETNSIPFSNTDDAREDEEVGGKAGRRATLNSREEQTQTFRRQYDKLTQYLDVVEVHLAQQVSQKSSVFSEAVCCHDIVREQLGETLVKVKQVREKLHQVDKSQTSPIISLLRSVRRRQNFRTLLDKLKIIASLQSAQPTIQMLLRNNDFCAALDLLTSTQALLRSFECEKDQPDSDHSTPTPEHRQITCLRHFSAQLVEIFRFIHHMIEAEFEAALRQFFEPRSDGDQAHSANLAPCVLGLLRVKRYDFVHAFRAELIRQIKMTQWLVDLCSTMSTDNSDLSQTEVNLKEHLRILSNDAWIDLLTKRCSQLQDLLTRSSEAVSVFVDVMSNIVHPSGSPSSQPQFSTDTMSSSSGYIDLNPTQLHSLSDKLRSALHTGCMTAQKHVIDLVTLRSKYFEGSKTDDCIVDCMSLNEFIRLAGILEDFQVFVLHIKPSDPSSELDLTTATTVSDNPSPGTVPSGTNTTPIGRLLLNLSRNAVNKFHHNQLARLEPVLSRERWQAASISTEIQQMVVHTFADQSSIPPGCRQLDTGHGSSTSSLLNHPVDSYFLNMNGERFMVVGTLILLLNLMADYMTLAERIPCKPWSVYELSTKLADLLNSFNSRTCQLVLGAEARRSADLQTISARNLALASRSLQLVAKCILSVNSYFERLIDSQTCGSPNHAMDPSAPDLLKTVIPKSHRNHNPLLHVHTLIREHIDQNQDKLFNLLSDRIQDRLSVWHVRPPTPSAELRAICRALSRVADLTSDVLPTDMLYSILLRAHNEFKTQLRHRLNELGVLADGGPKQSLVDTELTYYINQLRNIAPTFSNFTDTFMDVWATN